MILLFTFFRYAAMLFGWELRRRNPLACTVENWPTTCEELANCHNVDPATQAAILLNYYEALTQQQYQAITKLRQDLAQAQADAATFRHWRVTPGETMN